MTILLTDDHPELLEVLHEALAAQGHQVWTARNGNEACKLIAKITPQLLITDILMPERDGLELIREYRRHLPQGLVIAMSGGNDYLSGELCLNLASKLGADAVLNKPFHVTEFARMVERLAHRPSPGR